MTGTDLVVPSGLTPPDCDLRDFGHMPLDVRKFRDSDLVAVEDPEAIVAAVMLWGAAWHQIPAASLPDDDRVLASLAGYGIRASGVRDWRKVRDGALRGFVKCADGRLYHPLVAEKARTAWDGKLKQRWRTFGAAVRKHNERHPDERLDAPEFDEWLALSRPEKIADLPERKVSAGPLFDEPHGDPNVTRDNGPLSNVTSRVTQAPSHANVARETPSKGKGERKGERESLEEQHDNDSESRDAQDLLALTARITAAAGVSVIQPNRLAREMDIVKRWQADNVPTDLALSVIVKRLSAMRDDETVSSLAYFDSAVRKSLSLSSTQRATPHTPPPTLTVTDGDNPHIPRLRKTIRSTVGARVYDAWLRPEVAAFSLNGRSLTVTAASPFMADWVRSHFSTALATIAKVERVEVTSA